MRLFSPTSFWNTPLKNPKAHKNQAAILKEMIYKFAPSKGWSWPTINYKQWSCRLALSDYNTWKVKVNITDFGASALNKKFADNGGFRVPPDAVPAEARDAHLTVYDTYSDMLCGLWRAYWKNGEIYARWGGLLPKVSKSEGIYQYPYGESATGLPVIGGTIRMEEWASGKVEHVLAMSIPRPAKGHVWPANRDDGYAKESVIKEGTRFFLTPDTKIKAEWPPMLKIIVRAMITHGAVVRDRAGAIAFYGEEPRMKEDFMLYEKLTKGFHGWQIMKHFPKENLRVIA